MLMWGCLVVGKHMVILPRRVAVVRGIKTYYSGKPCRQGHDSGRYTGKGSCIACLHAHGKRAKESGYYRRRYLENREEILEAQRKAYPQKAEKKKENAANWSTNNKAARRAIAKNYKMKRRAQMKGGVSSSDLLVWTSTQKKVCFWCDACCSDNFHIDHWMPLALGGAHDISNLVISCPGCNLRKQAKHPLEFALSIAA